MHSSRLYRSRRLALLLLIGIPVLTLLSVGHILSVKPDGVKLLKRDGSTITFSLPWKSAATPGTAPTTASPALNYLDGITNVANALSKGGILVGENEGKSDPGDLPIVLKGVVSSLTQSNDNINPVNTAVGQGDLVNAGTSLVGQVLSTASSPSNVGALNTSKPTAGLDDGHSQGCGCSICGCAKSTLFPGAGHSTLGGQLALSITSPPVLLSTSSFASPKPVSSCSAIPTVTETWHSTHYAETVTLYRFMSIVTVTCTETVSSSCPSSPHLAPNTVTIPPQPTGLVQCANGSFVKNREDCPTLMMNNSTFPGPVGSSCQPCPQNGWYCPPIAGNSSPNGTTPSNSSTSVLPTLSPNTRRNTTTFSKPIPSLNGNTSAPANITTSPLLSSLSSSLSPNSTISVSVFQTTGVSSSQTDALAVSSTLLPTTRSNGNSPSEGLGTPSLSLAPSRLLTSTPSISVTSPLPISTNVAPSQITPVPINVSEYGSRVLQGVESGVKGALSNLSGLTGNLLSTVLAEVNSVLAVALSTAAPIPSKIDSVLSILPTPAVNTVAGGILPTASQVVSNLVNTAGAVVSPLSVVNNLGGSVLPIASPVASSVPGNVAGGLAAVISPVPAVVNNLSGGTLQAASPAVNNVAGAAVGGALAAANGAPRIVPI